MSIYSRSVTVLLVYTDPKLAGRIKELLQEKLIETVFNLKSVQVEEAFKTLSEHQYEVCLLGGKESIGLLSKAKTSLSNPPSFLVLDVEDSDEQEDLIHAGALDALSPQASVSSSLNHSVRMASFVYSLKNELAEDRELLTELSVLDETTGLCNQSHFENILSKEWNRAIRDKTILSIALINIDFYKPYNDDYAPEDGLSTVQQVADVIKGRVKRTTDLAAYHNDGIFALILSNTPPDGAEILCEILRERIEKVIRPMRSEGQTNKDVTASFGIASISPQFGSSHDSIIAMANDALHEAIKSGANQVKLYCGSDMAIEGVENESNSQAEENIYLIASLVAFAAFVAAILWVFMSE